VRHAAVTIRRIIELEPGPPLFVTGIVIEGRMMWHLWMQSLNQAPLVGEQILRLITLGGRVHDHQHGFPLR
jgi:hypothetical protein